MIKVQKPYIFWSSLIHNMAKLVENQAQNIQIKTKKIQIWDYLLSGEKKNIAKTKLEYINSDYQTYNNWIFPKGLALTQQPVFPSLKQTQNS